ncbi:hypothetical protein TNCV_2485521 [Trichonephila clavipes]|uniref:Uncharacterized protein n=1 Tax=Trichonephila clavipes TaxID=2585209 RepID=A0A8X6VZG6_TRICX|nr:hypothetical protein TNCV_2485521 [Trichonephila clavipes]
MLGPVRFWTPKNPVPHRDVEVAMVYATPLGPVLGSYPHSTRLMTDFESRYENELHSPNLHTTTVKLRSCNTSAIGNRPDFEPPPVSADEDDT